MSAGPPMGAPSSRWAVSMLVYSCGACTERHDSNHVLLRRCHLVYLARCVGHALPHPSYVLDSVGVFCFF